MSEHGLPIVPIITNEPIVAEPINEPVTNVQPVVANDDNKGPIPPRLRSRKLWALIAGIITLIVSIYVPEMEEVTTEITTIIGGYILGQGAVDVAKEIK